MLGREEANCKQVPLACLKLDRSIWNVVVLVFSLMILSFSIETLVDYLQQVTKTSKETPLSILFSSKLTISFESESDSILFLVGFQKIKEAASSTFIEKNDFR